MPRERTVKHGGEVWSIYTYTNGDIRIRNLKGETYRYSEGAWRWVHDGTSTEVKTEEALDILASIVMGAN